MPDLKALQAANERRWTAAKVTRDFTVAAKRLVAAKSHYQTVAAKTGVPWPIIAVIHERESSQSWNGSLAQGDPWNRVSVHKPAGRGPFSSWEEAAIDALVNCRPYAARWKDWSAGGALTLLEQYNGLGYASGPVIKQNGVVVRRFPPQPSPYIWSGTDQYRSGKYVSDGVYDPDTVDKQLGCAGLLIAMMKLDSTIAFAGSPQPGPAPVQPPAPQPAPAKGSLLDAIINLLADIFRRK